MPDKLYEIRSHSKGDGKLYRWEGYYSYEEAAAHLNNYYLDRRAEWANQYHENWHIFEIDVSGEFVIPSRPTPRERFVCRFQKIEPPDRQYWSTSACQAVDTTTEQVVAEWTYRYSGRPPFEPFRQGDKYYALMSEHYTATSVMDLQTGQVIAAEEPSSGGFCPVGFYVPDWWDVHNGSIKPGGAHWKKTDEKPDGSYGFVWGCVWGDDGSWKGQHLDLAKISEGVILRDDRYGYVELADITDNPKDFIHVSSDGVTFATWQHFRTDGTAFSPLD